MRHPVLFSRVWPLVGSLWLGAATAQKPPSRTEAIPPAVTVLEDYSEEVSRAAFAAIDADADDRLSIFEIGKAAPEIGTRADPRTFRGLDRDNDGYLSWPEFDAHLRRLLERGPFRFHALRPYTPPASRTSPATAGRAASLFAQLDRNGDGRLPVTELEAFVTDAGLPPQARSIVMALDRDRSGDVSVEELESVARLLEADNPTPADPSAGAEAETLPAPYAAADRNGDGVLDGDEVRSALVHLDPGLGRWADVILTDADRSRSATLGAAELRIAQQAAAADPLEKL